MLTIRLQRIGRRNNPSYRVVVVESKSAVKKGKPVEILGFHDTIRKQTELKSDRIQHWISQGAQVSDTMHNVLVKHGILEGKKINVLPKKKPIITEVKEEDAETPKVESKESTEESNDAPEETEDNKESAEESNDTPEETEDNKESTETPQEQTTNEDPSTEG